MTSAYPLPNGQELLIRIAEPSDAALALVYVEKVSGESEFLSMGPGDFTMTLEEEAAFLLSYKKSPNCVFFVAFVAEELVAIANVGASSRPRMRHRGEFGISVRKPFWGQGIGGLLLDHLVEWAKANSALSKLDLRVHSGNARAIALYRSRGFVEEGLLKNQVCIDGEHYDHLAMGLHV